MLLARDEGGPRMAPMAFVVVRMGGGECSSDIELFDLFIQLAATWWWW